jgi:hypothetical protein
MADVLTRSYDNHRTGANPAETILNPTNVHQLRRLFSLNLTSDARGIEAQPLIVTGVKMPDGQVHDVVYLCSMANTVWAFDAHTGAKLWPQPILLGKPVNGSHDIDLFNINDHWGILSTPAIDRATETIYLVSWSSPDGSWQKGVHRLHALSIVDGREIHPALDLEGATYDPGGGLPVQVFRSVERKQRPGLLLTPIRDQHGQAHKTVFIGFGSVKESGTKARGWVIACNLAPFRIAAAWASTVKGFGGGIWQGGQGLAGDDGGSVYAMTGNGTFDGAHDFAESFVKLHYTPAGAGAEARLRIVDWFTPYTDAGRIGKSPAEMAPAPDNEEAHPTNVRALAQAGMGGDWGDQDLGSGGPVLIPGALLVVGAGKDGILYVLDQNKFGKTSHQDLIDPAKNYAKLKFQPIFFTYFPGFQVSPAPQNAKGLNIQFDGRTHHLHGAPLFWDSAEHGPMLFCWGENGNLRAWSVNRATGTVTYLACSHEVASPATAPPGGMPGSMMCVSSDGAKPGTGIVWALTPDGDANQTVTTGVFRAYHATEFDTNADGSKAMRVLWDSSHNPALAFKYNKFCVPVVANGKVYVPTYEDRVDVYGL